MKLAAGIAVVVALSACAGGHPGGTDGAVVAADGGAPGALADGSRGDGAERADPAARDGATPTDAPDRARACFEVCGFLTEPCAFYTPPQAEICQRDCAAGTDQQIACAWQALYDNPGGIDRACVEAVRCLQLVRP